MDYISTPNPDLAVTLLMGGFSIFLLGVFLTRSLHPVLFTLAMLPGVAAMVLGGVLGIMSSGATDAVSKAVSEEYGVELSKEQVLELRYPETQPEAGKEKVYGLTDAAVNGKWQRVSLIWTGEEMQLVTVADDGTLGAEIGLGKLHGKPTPKVKVHTMSTYGKLIGKPIPDAHKLFGKPMPLPESWKVRVDR